MPYELLDLVVDRVDFVDEGANSAAFIELYKRKENCDHMDFEEILAKLKPEHADVVRQVVADKDAELSKARGDLDDANQSLALKSTELDTANDALAKANAELETLKAKQTECADEADHDDDDADDTEKSAAFDETETIKSMPENIRELFAKERAKREAAEEQIRKAAEEKAEAEAVAKAASLKALPVESSKLVGILKNCSQEVFDVLTAANNAIKGNQSVTIEGGNITVKGADGI